VCRRQFTSRSFGKYLPRCPDPGILIGLQDSCPILAAGWSCLCDVRCRSWHFTSSGSHQLFDPRKRIQYDHNGNAILIAYSLRIGWRGSLVGRVFVENRVAPKLLLPKSTWEHGCPVPLRLLESFKSFSQKSQDSCGSVMSLYRQLVSQLTIDWKFLTPWRLAIGIFNAVLVALVGSRFLYILIDYREFSKVLV